GRGLAGAIAAEQSGDAAARNAKRHVVDGAGGLVELDEMRDLDRRGPFRTGRAQLGRDCVVIPHAGRSLSHRGAKRKTLDPSALLNLVLQIAFNPMQRLEPVYAAALLALNIAELAGLLFLTGGLQNPFSFLFLAPVLISATALPVRLTIALGALAVACASALVFFHLPLPWESDEPLVLPPIYLFGVWLSIVLAIGVTSLYSFQVTEEARKLSDALAATELV